MSTEIAIVDDHKLFRQGLKELINCYDKEKKYKVMFESANGKDMIEAIKQGKSPSIILMDINMPEMDGFEAVKWLRENHPTIMIIVMSTREDSESVIKMLQMGVKGYISKTSDITDLHDALNAISNMGFFHSEFVSSHLIKMLYINKSNDVKKEIIDNISANERKFLSYACMELTYAEIAEKMKLSPKTIDSYRDSLFKKLDVKSRVGLVLVGIKLGFCHIN